MNFFVANEKKLQQMPVPLPDPLPRTVANWMFGKKQAGITILMPNTTPKPLPTLTPNGSERPLVLERQLAMPSDGEPKSKKIIRE